MVACQVYSAINLCVVAIKNMLNSVNANKWDKTIQKGKISMQMTGG